MAGDGGALRATYIPTSSAILPNTEFREGESHREHNNYVVARADLGSYVPAMLV